jgi:hypothetical protein
VTKHPEKTPPEGEVPQPKVRKLVRPIIVPVRRNFSADLSMTSDRPCISDSGAMVHAGTKVTYLGHLPGQAVKVRMEDGSEEVVHPHCFPELR